MAHGRLVSTYVVGGGFRTGRSSHVVFWCFGEQCGVRLYLISEINLDIVNRTAINCGAAAVVWSM